MFWITAAQIDSRLMHIGQMGPNQGSIKSQEWFGTKRDLGGYGDPDQSDPKGAMRSPEYAFQRSLPGSPRRNSWDSQWPFDKASGIRGSSERHLLVQPKRVGRKRHELACRCHLQTRGLLLVCRVALGLRHAKVPERCGKAVHASVYSASGPGEPVPLPETPTSRSGSFQS
jgi:hypothetical protein